MGSKSKGLAKALETRAYKASDTDETKLKKDLLILTCGLMNLGVVGWLGIYWAMGIEFSTTVPLCYQIISVASLAIFLTTRNFDIFRIIQLSLFLFAPFVMQWSIGNYVTSSGVALWAFLAPLGAMFLYGYRASVPWFAAYIILNALSGFFDYYLMTGIESGVPLQTIAVFFSLNFVVVSTIIFILVRYFVREQDIVKKQLDKNHSLLLLEQQKSESLLLNMLPAHITKRLKQESTTIADGHADITVVFADIINFTCLTEEMSPQQMVVLLNNVFSSFDSLVEKYNLEKIKTIGDAYMAAGGLNNVHSDYVAAMADMTLEMTKLITEKPEFRKYNLGLHIGISTGPLVGGVIGTKRLVYDLWGDTVNIASRLSTYGISGKIQVDTTTYNRLRNHYQFDGPHKVTVKGKGEITMYLLEGPKVEK
ncbi:MAG: adenylate/guanylate cyclase domain-containing protein [Nitrosomonadaceae bacterium]